MLAYEAPLVVNGLFMLGLGNDWSWDRFRRRVYQSEHDMEGVFHEFTGVAAVVEQLKRLQYRIDLVHQAGFIARRIEANADASLQTLDESLSYPYLCRLNDYATGDGACCSKCLTLVQIRDIATMANTAIRVSSPTVLSNQRQPS